MPDRNLKTAWRQEARQRRAQRDPFEAARADARRTAHLLERLADLTPASGSVSVAAYCSLPDEPDTRELLRQCWATGVRVLLPIVSTGRSQPAWGWCTTGDDLVPSRAGLLEPAGTPLPSVVLADVDVICCPGLAGGRDGTRLGTGGGWYDRALAQARPDTPRWLLLFADEVGDHVPTEPHDLTMTALVTEAGWTQCHPHHG